MYRTAPTCPQGHPVQPQESPEDICPACPVTFIWPLRPEVFHEIEAHRDDPTFHPEWRIGKQAKDLTAPENLLPLVKAWIGQQPDDESWTYQVAWRKGQAVGNLYDICAQAWGRYYGGDDAENEWVALAQAFAEALEVQKGEDHDG